MNRPQLYFKSTGYMLEGYRNETLMVNDWGGCVVGHLIANNNGIEIRVPKSSGYSSWHRRGKPASALEYGIVLRGSWWQQIKHHYKIGEEAYNYNQQLLASTGYINSELRAIMKAFDGWNPSVFNVREGLEAAVWTLRKMHRVGFAAYSRDVKKRLIRQNRRILQKSDRYTWLNNLFNKCAYPIGLRFDERYRKHLYWRVLVSYELRMMATRIESMVNRFLLHPLQSSFSIFNQNCLTQHLSIAQKPVLRHEIITSYTHFNCFVNCPTCSWAKQSTAVRYHAGSVIANGKIAVAGRNSVYSLSF